MNRARKTHADGAEPKPIEKADAKASTSVEIALGKNKEVEEIIVERVVELGTATQTLEVGAAQSASLLATLSTLAQAERKDGKVQEWVEELHVVNEALTQGMNELKRTEMALEESRKSLEESQQALANALEEIKQVRDLALHDALTGLPNRELFNDRLGYAIALAHRRDWNLAVMFIDLDGFKGINDTLGHAAGDEVLTRTAKRLTKKLRFADTVSRYGGDEFVLLLMNPQAHGNIQRIAEEVLAELAEPFMFGDQELAIRASLGIAVYPDHAMGGDELIQKADAAMYVAKKAGGCVAFS